MNGPQLQALFDAEAQNESDCRKARELRNKVSPASALRLRLNALADRVGSVCRTIPRPIREFIGFLALMAVAAPVVALLAAAWSGV